MNAKIKKVLQYLIYFTFLHLHMPENRKSEFCTERNFNKMVQGKYHFRCKVPVPIRPNDFREVAVF